MIQAVVYYFAVCDNCGHRLGPFASDTPARVAHTVATAYDWTASQEWHHCGACSPLCSSCGFDDADCTCPRAPRDSAYVSREPSVIHRSAVDTCGCCPLDQDDAGDGQG